MNNPWIPASAGMTVRGVRVLAGVLLLATVCAAPAAASERLLVFAAASLQGAVDAVAQGFERAGGARVALSFAASSTLARQIEQGAAADVYVSASPKWMDRLERRRWLRPGTRGDPPGNPLGVGGPAGGGRAPAAACSATGWCGWRRRGAPRP